MRRNAINWTNALTRWNTPDTLGDEMAREAWDKATQRARRSLPQRFKIGSDDQQPMP